MKRHILLQRVLTAAVSLVVTAFFLVVALPHHHDIGASQPLESCRLQKVHQGVSPAPAASSLVQQVWQLVDYHPLVPHDAPRTFFLVRLSASRAPPALS